MKINEAILDTGPLVAALSARDEFHRWAEKTSSATCRCRA